MKKNNIIWIIDDDPIYIFGVTRKLKQINTSKSIRTLDNGEEALGELHDLAASEEKSLPGLILLDINMPNMDGWQFLKELETMPCNRVITVYLVTSSIDPHDIKRARDSKLVSGYLNKPLKTEKIQGILEEYSARN